MLSDILYKLLYHKNFRDKFLKGEELDICENEAKALHSIDKSELLAMSQLIIKKLLYSISGYGGELYASFPNVFKIISSDLLITIVEEFLESKDFSNYHIIPFQGKGLCLQESFYNFLKKHIKFQDDFLFQEVLKHDFLTSSIRLLSTNKNPSFRFDSDLFIFKPSLIFSIQNYTKKFLEKLKITHLDVAFIYAYNGRQVIIGPLPSFYAEIISSNSTLDHLKNLSQRFGIAYEEGLKAYHKVLQLALITTKAA